VQNIVAQVDAVTTNCAVQSNNELFDLLFAFATQATVIPSFRRFRHLFAFILVD
jgi:hypothetical protein